MRFVSLVAALILVPGLAFGQLASSFSHGPTIPMYSVRFDAAGAAHSSFLSEGAGYSFNANFAPSQDGKWRYFTIGLPIFMQVPQEDGLSFSAGLTFGTFNNLISAGVALDMADLGPGEESGLLVGKFTKENVALLVGFNLNFGSGSKPEGYQAKLGFGSSSPIPPPGYFDIW